MEVWHLPASRQFMLYSGSLAYPYPYQAPSHYCFRSKLESRRVETTTQYDIAQQVGYYKRIFTYHFILDLGFYHFFTFHS
jgi:hypothetical protein